MRLKRLQATIRHPVSILGHGEGGHFRYLTGVGGLSGILLVTKRDVFLISSDTDLAKETGIRNIIRPKKKHSEELFRLLTKMRISTLGVDAEDVPYRTYEKMRGHRIKIEDVGDVLWKMRSIKEKDEIVKIKRACALADRAMNAARHAMRAGVTEREVGRAAANAVLGKCDKLAFDFIVASGKHSLYTHTYPTNKRIQPSDLVIVDLGVTVDGYNSDTTRTFCLKPDERRKKLYAQIVEAYRVAMSAVRPGAKCSFVCHEVEKRFSKSGLLPYWKYGLGHGVGIDVHESPSLSKDSKDVLRSGMVFTIEPGLHVPGIGGVRIEDTVLLGKNPQRLTHSAIGLVP